DVWHDLAGHKSPQLPVGDEPVCAVVAGGLYVSQPQVIACPVVAPEVGIPHDLLVGHRGAGGGVRATVVGDARRGGDAGTGEDHGQGAPHEFGECTGPVPEVDVRCGALGRGQGGLP